MPAHKRKTKNAQNREIDPLPTPLQDTPKFKAYADKVKKLVLKTKCGVTQSEINRSLQPPHVDWTACALEQLFESVEKRDVGVFEKWFPRVLRRTPDPTEHNYHAGMFVRPATKTSPHVESIYGEI